MCRCSYIFYIFCLYAIFSIFEGKVFFIVFITEECRWSFILLSNTDGILESDVCSILGIMNTLSIMFTNRTVCLNCLYDDAHNLNYRLSFLLACSTEWIKISKWYVFLIMCEAKAIKSNRIVVKYME